MDTVFYVEGVANGTADELTTGAIELFTHHSRYTKDEVNTFIEDKIKDKTFDSYANDVLKESARWLKGSLDQSLTIWMSNTLSKIHHGPGVWMCIVSEVQSAAIDRCKDITKKFDNMKLSDFPGENVDDYCLQAEDLLKQLENEGQLPSTHLLTIVDAMKECSVLAYKVQWITKRAAVIDFIRESAGKDPTVVAKMRNRVDYGDLLAEAKTLFQDHAKEWGPATNAKANEAQAQATVLKKMQAMVGQVQQTLKASNNPSQSTNKFKGKKCFGCGKADTIKPKCPNCSKDKNNTPATSNTGGGGGSGNNGGGAGKFAPPKGNEPTTKEINGKKLHWCPKCKGGKGFWVASHTADKHEDNYKPKKNNEAATPSASVGELDLSKVDLSKYDEGQIAMLQAFLGL
jgi:hypothetical protein